MKVIIAGSRYVEDYSLVEAAVEESKFAITEVVSGGARGVDRLGERLALSKSLPLRVFNAEWERYGRSAGHIRNKAMAEYADALIALPKGESRGTRNMIHNAEKLGLKVYVRECE